MGAREFGRLVEQAMAKKEMSQARLAVLVGLLPEGRVLNETQIRRIREGSRRLDEVLVSRLIALLDLDPAEAWHAAGLWPEGLDPEDLRDISELRAARLMAATRAALPSEGASSAATASSISDPEDLMRSCAPFAGQGMREAA
jgi:transcriptional regulator with XRE-family HTH domain